MHISPSSLICVGSVSSPGARAHTSMKRSRADCDDTLCSESGAPLLEVLSAWPGFGGVSSVP